MNCESPRNSQVIAVALILSLLMASSSLICHASTPSVSYLYTLSDFTGTIPYGTSARPVVDLKEKEIYIADSMGQSARIFNEKGMEIFEFGFDEKIGNILDVAVEENGNILVLSTTQTMKQYSIIQCNFRGEFLSKIAPRNLPSGFMIRFFPTVLVYHNSRLYLVDESNLKIAMIDASGLFLDGIEIAPLLNATEKNAKGSGKRKEKEKNESRDWEIGGFHVDREGNMFFTVPLLFSAYKLSSERTLSSFGTRGSAPGKFNVVGGITTDDMGYCYVVDTLRCVVMVFDENFTFLTEFGYRGYAPENLIAPTNLATDGKGKIYVNQGGNRGINVYQISFQ